ncbi:MAG: hypothetical protein ACTSQY_00965 [Candidatus Odinarchaeia archaeon]
MAVTKTSSTTSGYIAYTGTLSEVINALAADKVPIRNVIIYYNGTNITAVAQKGVL